MKIVCAASLHKGFEAFSHLGDVTLLPEEDITADDVRDADCLITRSKAKINRALLEGSSVRFVGCAVAGMDHMDIDYLESADIAWCHAPGCNANSVAEYVVTALLIEAERHGWELDGQVLGIIGVGNIGRRLVQKALDLGLQVLCSDPPREAKESLDDSFVPLETLLAASDFVTLHVPYTTTGPCATAHMINHRFFEVLDQAKLFINAARGEIMDSEAVRVALEHGIIRQAVLDVWENEPKIDDTLLAKVDIATPHIAGYSWEGRLNGTCMVYEEACRFFEVEPTWLETDEADPTQGGREYEFDGTGQSDQAFLKTVTSTVYPLLADDRHFREGVRPDRDQTGAHFVYCRRTYPERREFAAARLTLQNAPPKALDALWALGFQVCA